MPDVESAPMPTKKKTSSPHRNPRFLVSGTDEELDKWDAAAAAIGTNRVAWIRALANAAAALSGKTEPERAWKAARAADVAAIAEEIAGRVAVNGPTTNPRAITPARLEGMLAERSGHPGWKVRFIGQEFEAKEPKMPKGWKP